jgi:hypothetical protein
MVDEIQPDAASEIVCTWCSAPLSSADLERCPSCGAILVGESVESLPGVTAVDVTAIVRGAPTTVRSRNRLLSWISGDYPEEARTADESKALEPPDLEVRREILRLELEGEVAKLKAQADALVAEAAAEGRVVEPPDITALSAAGVAAAEEAEAEVAASAEDARPQDAEPESTPPA